VEDRIVLAKENHIPLWLRSAYTALITDDNSLKSPHVMEKLGPKCIFKILRARESALLEREDAALVRQKIEGLFEVELHTLGDLTAIERAVRAKEYDVPKWRKDAFLELTERPQIISVEEAKTLGFETAIRLCGARDLRTTLGLQGAVQQELSSDLGPLDTHTAVERVILAREYGVAAWLQEALCDLGTRQESLSFSEASEIRLDTAIALFRS
ncbi:hypothetical protein H0H92_000294, partial [Tricholoma furcatifolium]